jgi:hypothetical protein
VCWRADATQTSASAASGSMRVIIVVLMVRMRAGPVGLENSVQFEQLEH